jgi:PAS domain S-box-containing protein
MRSKKPTHTSFFQKSILIISLCLIFQSGWLFAAQKQKAIRVGIFQNKPLSYMDDQGVAQGIYPDVIREIAEIENWEIEFAVDTWSGNLERLKTGNIDLIVSIVYSKERDEIFDFSMEPVVTAWGQVYTSQDSGIHSILDLEGKNLAVMEKDINAQHFIELCKKFNVNCNIINVKIYDDVCELIVSKKADAGVINNINGEFLKRKYDIHATPIMFSPVKAVFAVPEGKNQHLTNKIDAYLSQWRDDQHSNYYRILNKWFGDIKGESQFSLKLIIIVSSVAGGISLFLFVWLNLLRNQIRARTKELMESEKKYRNIFENAVVGFFQSTPGGRFLDVNPAFASMFGYSSPEELITRVSDIAKQLYAHPEDRRRYQELLLDQGYVENFAFIALRKDRSRTWISISTRAVFDQDGKIIRYEGAAIDIEERKRAEKELENQNRIMTTLLDNLQVGVFMVKAPTGKPIMANKYAKELLGRGIMDSADKGTLADVYQAYKLGSDELYPVDQMPIVKGLMGEKHSVDDMVIVQPGGNQVFLEVFGSPVKDKQGNIVASLASFSDITYRKKAEEERIKLESRLQQAQRMEAIGTLAGGIAHDFNNILFPIIGFAEMAKDDLQKDSPLQDNINEIVEGAKRARELVKQILTFSRQAEHELTPLKIQIILKEVLKLTRSTLPSTIEIKQNISDACGFVLADATRVHQIAMNLITNAYHAMQETGGNLEVSLEEVELGPDELSENAMMPGRYVRLIVADTGYGMEQSVMDRIFDPYFTTKGIAKGTGMGLAIVHGIVKSYGGDIRVSSEIGKGTVFQVHLPVVKSSVEAMESETNGLVQEGNERILLVDDEDQIVRMVQQMLERLGYQVVAQTSSTAALASFRQSPESFDIVITDMTMPNMTGPQLAQHLKKIKPDIPIIICTGFSEQVNEERVRAIGIHGLVMKPVVKKELAKAIREALDKG